MRRLQNPLAHLSDMRLVQPQDSEVVDVDGDGRAGQVGTGTVVEQVRNLGSRPFGDADEESLAKPKRVRPPHRHHSELRIDDGVGSGKAVDILDVQLAGE